MVPVGLYRVEFAKEADARFLSHLDTLRVLARSLRRAGLPPELSQGFHPHPRLSLASALALGLVGEAEVADVGVAREIPPADLCDLWNRKLPPGFRIRRARTLDPSRRPPRVEGAIYRLRPVDPPSDLSARIAELLSREEIPHVRRDSRGERFLDLRPFIFQLEYREGEVELGLGHGPGRQARPEEVAEVLGISTGMIRRIALLGREGSELRPLFELS